MGEIESMQRYLQTPVEEMRALDDERRQAEQDCADGETWLALAVGYELQGRPAQAASCERRAAQYRAVAVETAAYYPRC